MKPILRDLTFAGIARRYRQDKIMNTERPNMPDLTPAVGGGLASVALLVGYASQASDWKVEVTALVCAALVAVFAGRHEQNIRLARHGTEQARLEAMGQPDVFVTDDPQAAMDELEGE